ncbi:MAG: hypothetical protein ACK4UN_13415, partial [Limisphaerales bacterium]
MEIPSEFPGKELVSAFMRVLPPNARTRGERYFQSGRVTNLQMVKAGEFTASVRGGDVYTVTLT